MRKTIAMVLMLLPALLAGQVRLEVNGLLDVGLSRAGEDSRFYYNGIDKEYTGWRFGITEINGLATLRMGKRWAVNSRLALGRRKGGPLDRFFVPLLNVEWTTLDGQVQLRLGRFVNPFGSFNALQLSTDRLFVALPLPYQYGIRVSDEFGGLYYGPSQELAAGKDHALPVLYYGGYQSGLRFDWTIQPDRLSLAAALTAGAPITPAIWSEPMKLGAVARLLWRPAFFWEQGFSAGYGPFMKRTDNNPDLPAPGDYRQLLIGTDFTGSYGFWELSGELMAGWHHIPFFDANEKAFIRDNYGNLLEERLFNWSGYATLKFEPPFASGSYLAYRYGWTASGKSPAALGAGTWEGTAQRHSFAVGYRLTRWLLLRSAVFWQQTKGQEGDYWAWQTVATFHF